MRRLAGRRLGASLATSTPPHTPVEMLFRAAQRTARLARPVAQPAFLARSLATEAVRPPPSRQYAAVEDLHHRTAEEILQERDAAKASGAFPLAMDWRARRWVRSQRASSSSPPGTIPPLRGRPSVIGSPAGSAPAHEMGAEPEPNVRLTLATRAQRCGTLPSTSDRRYVSRPSGCRRLTHEAENCMELIQNSTRSTRPPTACSD